MFGDDCADGLESHERSENFIMKKKKVKFRCHFEDGKQVFLAGDFNDWSPDKTPMGRVRGGWSVGLDLSPGRYEYKFVVDGEWKFAPLGVLVDTSSECCLLNPFGTYNWYVDVSP